MLTIVVGALLAFAPGVDPPPAPPRSPAEPAAAAVTVAAEKAKDEDPIVCRNQVVAGSHLPVKVCTRASDKASRKRSGRDAVDKLQLNNGMRGPKS